jgi:hypothetical protein
MLQSKSLSPKPWDEATNYEPYIQNRFLHKALNEVTPFEAWSGNKLEVTQFRAFGSHAWAHIPSYKRKDLEDTSKCTPLLL